jgi:FtsP/CotA-like multicopper oxidase with cupredoxin domain
MQAKLTRRIGPSLILLVIASLLIYTPALAVSQTLAREQRPASAAVTIDLCAQPGSVIMPDTTVVTIWGFALDDGSCGNPATLPGPQLVVNEGDVVTVNLTNNLLENVSIIFPGQDLFPDTTGAASGGSVSYTFTAGSPGTYLYQAGTNPGVQVAMGLYGALIVRPATGANFAYNDTDTEFDAEAVLVLSELDADLNNLADPNTFDMLTYKPDYWLINGRSFPATILSPITAAPSERLLLRYLNAGLMHHTMQLVGAHQRVIAKDAYPLLNPFSAIAETLPSGQTADMIVNIPSAATAGTRYPLYNRQLHLTNAAARPGGMMTRIEVVPSPIDFNSYTIESYGSGQDTAGGATIEDGGATLRLTGNHWKRIAFPYTVTSNTLLEFDFMSSAQVEIHGIGLDENNLEQDVARTFQLYGTQTYAVSYQDFRDYAASAPGWKHYVIPVGAYYTGSMTHLTFTNDQDAPPIGESAFRNVRVYEGTPPSLIVNGSARAIESYGSGQDVTGSVTVEDNGMTLHIVGNRWKKVALPYTVTASTVIEFDFRSTVEGEIHGIGLDEDNLEQNTVRTFQLFGTQTFAIQAYNTYVASGWTHYVIPVGTFYTGSMLYVTFAHDHDVVSPTGESFFRNITVHD